MAIPTQFTTTQQAGRPISNPLPPVDYAYAIDSLDAALISGAASYTPETVPDINTPVVNTSVAIQDIVNPTLVSSVAIPDIDAPETSTAQSIPTLSTPTANTSVSIPTIDLPTVRSSVAIPTINTPSVFTSKGATDDTPPFPLNHARILYDNLLTSGSVTSNAASSNPQLALVPNTFQRWAFTSALTREIVFTLPSAIPMDTFCLGGHNLFFGSAGTRYRFSYSSATTGTYTVLDDWRTPASNAAGMVHTASAVNVRRLKLEIEASPSREKYVAYISAGIAMQMQRPFFNGHNPYPDSDVTEYYSSRSESGNIIGRQIRRKGFETQAEVNNLSDSWYRTYFSDFKEKAKLQPFFMAWNLLEYPTDVAFAETTDDIRASMQNGSIVKRNISFGYRGV